MDQSSPVPPRPRYFEVPHPWHFACRPDLAEELCIAEELMRRWPKDGGSLKLLCDHSGYREGTFDLADFHPGSRPNFHFGRRYVLLRATLPGEDAVRNLAMNHNGWCVPCENALADFVFARAIEFLVSKGVNQRSAQAWLDGVQGRNDGPVRRIAPCGIGYERGGLCSLLILGHESMRAFLKRQPGFLVPELPSR